jgi:hypothetical protein
MNADMNLVLSALVGVYRVRQAKPG